MFVFEITFRFCEILAMCDNAYDNLVWIDMNIECRLHEYRICRFCEI